MKFFISIGEYSDEIEFMTDAVRRLIETKEKATDQWKVNFEELITDIQKTDKYGQELLFQAEKVRKYIGNSNTSVVISLRVMRNGDTTGGVVNIGNALRLAIMYPSRAIHCIC